MSVLTSFAVITAVGLTTNIVVAYRKPKYLLLSLLTHPIGWVAGGIFASAIGTRIIKGTI